MVNIGLFEKESFFLVGYDDAGPADTAKEWIPPLWEQFNKDYAKLEALALKDAKGRVSVWGAMTDLGHEFEPWGEEGKYMAGVESERYLDALGFAVWHVPGFLYIRVEATFATYADVYREVLGELFPQNGWVLVGAVQEYYVKTKLYLLFPIKRL